MQIETLPSFPKHCNPFNHDLYHVGAFAGPSGRDETICFMFEKYGGSDGPNNYIIVVDCVTGQRIKVTFDRRGN